MGRAEGREALDRSEGLAPDMAKVTTDILLRTGPILSRINAATSSWVSKSTFNPSISLSETSARYGVIGHAFDPQ